MTTTNEPKQFDRFADDYKTLLDRSVSIIGEGGEYFAKVKASYLAAVLGSNFDGRILDYGCGVGLLSEALFDQFPKAQIDGFDPSAASIAALSSELKRTGKFTSVGEELYTGYDAIVLANVLHHVPPADRQRTIDFCVRLLSNSGRLFIFEHNPLNPITRLAVDRCPFDDDAILLWSGESLSLLKHSGLRDVTRNYIVFFPNALKAARPLERFLQWCPLGAQYVASGIKTQR